MFDLDALAAADRALASLDGAVSRLKLSEETLTTGSRNNLFAVSSERAINRIFTDSRERRCPYSGGHA